MNKQTRKRIEEIISKLESLKSEIEEIKELEQEKYDNLSEGLQATERGQKLEDCVSELEYAEGYCDDIISSLHTAIE